MRAYKQNAQRTYLHSQLLLTKGFHSEPPCATVGLCFLAKFVLYGTVQANMWKSILLSSYPRNANRVTAASHLSAKRQQRPVYQAAERNRKASKRIDDSLESAPPSGVPMGSVNW